ncbi:CBS domain-containing protein [Bradyrhizobium japonicum]
MLDAEQQLEAARWRGILPRLLATEAGPPSCATSTTSSIAEKFVLLDPDQTGQLTIGQDVREPTAIWRFAMQARDVMVSPVVTVGPTATVRQVAQMLLDRRISAVPVVDTDNKVIGIVSEGDLLHRAESGTERSSSWWLRLLTGDAQLATDYVKSHSIRVQDIMTQDVATEAPETPLHEIAMLLEERQVKRVPIVNKEGQLVGIVSRANLLQAIVSAIPKLEISLSDSAIRKRFLEEIRKQPWAHTFNLNATVQNGAIDLWGFAPSLAERTAIRVVAEAIPGVVAVNDHLLETPAFVY